MKLVFLSKTSLKLNNQLQIMHQRIIPLMLKNLLHLLAYAIFGSLRECLHIFLLLYNFSSKTSSPIFPLEYVAFSLVGSIADKEIQQPVIRFMIE